ncbi:MAG TPA: PQQ-binding-like beta-propeller repeat protein [Lacipirellulaceae bacterium]|nr:PQQ-binding-like beta-propeller repeat protein [Lacipirellulaceae bacterium]
MGNLTWMRRGQAAVAAVLVLGAWAFQGAVASAAEGAEGAGAPFSMVVMDPLAAPLSCPCVAGYAQRKYEVLGEYLSEQLHRPVTVTFAESIASALEREGVDEVHLVIGKDSVVRAHGKKLDLGVRRLARLTGKDGKTTQTGLVVVRAADAAQAVADLHGHRILYGPAECDEKFGAARRLLAEAGVPLAPPDEAETSAACSDGACTIIDWGDRIRGAAVISSYAAPLLEGCGTIKKGDLRVVGETKPVAFVAAFATNRLDEAERNALRDALLASSKEPGMLTALESMLGVVPVDFKPVEIPGATLPGDLSGPAAPQVEGGGEAARPSAAEGAAVVPAEAWSGWLGPRRDGRVAWLPERLPASPHVVWRHVLGRSGLGGLAATESHVILGDRDGSNRADVFRCLDATTGVEIWTVSYPAPGQLDYDNCPRAAPLIHQGRVYLFGAFGDLTCADLQTGAVVWRVNVRLKFLAIDRLPWGTCSSPLLVDDVIVVNPGAPLASLVGLDAATGAVRWKTPGEPQGHGSLIVATLGGVRQIVGHTQKGLHGWDPADGRELWTLEPPVPGDFNVPTPVAIGDRLLVCSENNGTRLFAFDAAGRILRTPVATDEDVAPQLSTPVAVGSRAYCVDRRLYAWDTSAGLAPLPGLSDEAFAEFGPLFATAERLLVQGRGGEMLLVDAMGEAPRIVSRWAPAAGSDEREAELLSSPALVGTRLFVRLDAEVVCVDLAAEEPAGAAREAGRHVSRRR